MSCVAPLWYASLFVVGVSLSVVSSTNDFSLRIGSVVAADSEEPEDLFPVAADAHPLTVGMEEELRGCF